MDPSSPTPSRVIFRCHHIETFIGKDIFFEALANASFTLRPSLIFLSAYSTTTIAPSTKRPTDKINANKTTIFIVNPITDRANSPDKKEPGMDTPTNKPDLIPKAPSIIIKTRIIAVSRSQTLSIWKWLPSSVTKR